MTADERAEALDVLIEREVDAKLAEEFAKRRAAVRQEVVDRINREHFEKRMRHINRRHPIEERRTPAVQAAYDAAADASHAAMTEKLARNNERYAALEEARAKGEASMPRMRLPGNPHDEGFSVKR